MRERESSALACNISRGGLSLELRRFRIYICACDEIVIRREMIIILSFFYLDMEIERVFGVNFDYTIDVCVYN